MGFNSGFKGLMKWSIHVKKIIYMFLEGMVHLYANCGSRHFLAHSVSI